MFHTYKVAVDDDDVTARDRRHVAHGFAMRAPRKRRSNGRKCEHVVDGGGGAVNGN